MHSVKSLLRIYLGFFLVCKKTLTLTSYTADFACICFELHELMNVTFVTVQNNNYTTFVVGEVCKATKCTKESE